MKAYKYLILFIFLSFSWRIESAELGRLFLTPGQRTQLDIARVKRDQRPLSATITAQDATTPAPSTSSGPAVVTYNGAVQRSDGRSTVWINGQAVNERNHLRNEAAVSVLGLQRDSALTLAIPSASRGASLKVGQSLDVTSGRIEEAHARHVTTPEPIKVTRPFGEAAAQRAPLHAGRPKTSTRKSDFLESDPASGAAPAERRP